MKKTFGRLILLALPVILLLAASNVRAQDLDDVSITGRVTDSNKLAIAGATITATETQSGAERTVTTNDEGRYRLIELKPGVYKITVTATGFGTQQRTDLQTISGQNVQLDFSLSPAGVAAEIVVSADDDNTPAVDTTRTVVGGTITERAVEELPNTNRNPLDLVLTLGGTAEEQLSTRDLADDRGTRGQSVPGTTPEEAGIFGLSGGAAYSNNITIDGLDNNDDRSASFRFQPSIESVAEVQVITNQFSAEYGRASGGRVNIRTRGGSNRFRGRAFYFYRDDAFNANTWNNNRNGIERPPFTNHNPGFTFGGPIVKDRLFFFTSYEYDDIADSTVLDAWVPVTLSNPSFVLPPPTNPNSTFTVTGGSPSIQVVTGRYITPTDTPATKHIFTGRADWNISKSQNLTYSYQLGRSNDLRAFSGTNRIADSLIGRIRDTDAHNFTHNWIISNRAVNQFRFQYSTLRPSSAQDAGDTTAAVLVTFTGPTGQGGTQVFGSTTNSSDRTEDRWQFQDTFNLVAGAHTFRFGGDIQRVDTVFTDRFDVTGTYTFSNFGFFVQNSVSRYQQNFNNTSEIKNHYTGLFIQDDWRLRSNLTFALGLRYERETVLKDDNNFGPRFAIAWNPFPKSSKTVIRVGAGIFYNRVLLRTVDDYNSNSESLRLDTNSFNLPAGVTPDSSIWRPFFNSRFPNGITADTVIPITSTRSFTAAELARPSTEFRSLSPDIVIPESYQFNVGFERELFKGLVFETNVTYNKTAHLWRETNPNAPMVPVGTPDRNSDGRVTLTDYLLGVDSGPNRFYQGAYTDTTNVGVAAGSSGIGTHTSPSDASPNCTSSTPICYVNVNTANSNSSTSCSTTTTTNTAVCRAFAAVNGLRRFFNQVGAVQLEEVASIGNSEYLGAIFELRTRHRRFKNGFGGSMRLVYTLSRLMDDGIVNTSDPTLPGDFSREWSRSLADRTHRIAFTGNFDTPWWMGKLRISPLLRWGSSAPFNLSAGGIDRSLDDVSNDRPSFTGDPDDIQWRVFGSQPFPQDVANHLSVAPIGSPGTLPRNAGHGPQLFQFNLSVTREFRFGERFRLRPMAEATNVFNSTVYSFGSNFINLEDLTTTAGQDGFLAPTRTGIPRRFRFGVRFDF
jgi:hypothetical protein